MTHINNDFWKGVEPEPIQANPSGNIPVSQFKDRSSIELAILMKEGRWVDLRGYFYLKDENGEYVLENGEKVMSKRIYVPVWRMQTALECADILAIIISELFPRDLLFLLQIDMRHTATAARQILGVFGRIYDNAIRMIQLTLDLTDAERADIERHLFPQDFLEIFCTILEDSVLDNTIELVLKRIRARLATKFNLENIWPNFNDIMASVTKQLSEPTQ